MYAKSRKELRKQKIENEPEQKKKEKKERRPAAKLGRARDQEPAHPRPLLPSLPFYLFFVHFFFADGWDPRVSIVFNPPTVTPA
jgi:hypothetical protein